MFSFLYHFEQKQKNVCRTAVVYNNCLYNYFTVTYELLWSADERYSMRDMLTAELYYSIVAQNAEPGLMEKLTDPGIRWDKFVYQTQT